MINTRGFDSRWSDMTANSESERRHDVPRNHGPVPAYLKLVARGKYAPIKYLEWRHVHLSDQVTNRTIELVAGPHWGETSSTLALKATTVPADHGIQCANLDRAYDGGKSRYSQTNSRQSQFVSCGRLGSLRARTDFDNAALHSIEISRTRFHELIVDVNCQERFQTPITKDKGTELCARVPEAAFDLSSGSRGADMAYSAGLTQQRIGLHGLAAFALVTEVPVRWVRTGAYYAK
jgi:hypothetical protein